MPWNPPHVSLAQMTDLTWNAHYNAAPPRFFLTGDGHRTPPFAWAVNGVSQAMTLHFRMLAAQNLLCAGVETFQDQVNLNSVPPNLAPVFGNNCVFGWEPPIMRVVGTTIDQILAMVPGTLSGHPAGEAQVQQDVVQLDQSIGLINAALGTDIPLPVDIRVTNAATDWAAIKLYLDGVYGTGSFFNRFSTRSPRVGATETAHRNTLIQLQTGLMTLRDSMNPVFGARILAEINNHPGHTHLITCGWAHLQNVNPVLQNCINIGAANGIVDSNTR